MANKKFRIYPGMVNYTIQLDDENRILSLRYGNDYPFYRNTVLGNKINENIEILKIALKYMLIEEPQNFEELYKLLKDNDPEMFAYVEEVVDELGGICLKISSTE